MMPGSKGQNDFTYDKKPCGIFQTEYTTRLFGIK